MALVLIVLHYCPYCCEKPCSPSIIKFHARGSYNHVHCIRDPHSQLTRRSRHRCSCWCRVLLCSQVSTNLCIASQSVLPLCFRSASIASIHTSIVFISAHLCKQRVSHLLSHRSAICGSGYIPNLSIVCLHLRQWPVEAVVQRVDGGDERSSRSITCTPVSTPTPTPPPPLDRLPSPLSVGCGDRGAVWRRRRRAEQSADYSHANLDTDTNTNTALPLEEEAEAAEEDDDANEVGREVPIQRHNSDASESAYLVCYVIIVTHASYLRDQSIQDPYEYYDILVLKSIHPSSQALPTNSYM